MGLEHSLSRHGSILTNSERDIFDDSFHHSLMVYQDDATGGLRLHAAVLDGELRQCPVWTAFGNMPIDGGYRHHKYHIILT